MELDNNKRAVLSIAALTKLAYMRRVLTHDDASGQETIEFLERLVINGSVAERDEVLQCFEKDESFTLTLTSKRPLVEV